MTPITKREDLNKLIKQEQVIIIFHRNWCSNCNKMKPKIEALESDMIKVYDVFLKDWEAWDFIDILKKFSPKHQFPYVCTFSSWKMLNWFYAVFDPQLLMMSFEPIEKLKNDIAEWTIGLQLLQEEYENAIKLTKLWQDTRVAIYRRRVEILENPEKEEDEFILWNRTVDENELKPCESGCQ